MTWTSIMAITLTGSRAKAPGMKVQREQQPRTGSVRSCSRKIQSNMRDGNGPEIKRSISSAILREELLSDYLSISWQMVTLDIQITLVSVEEMTGQSL